MTGPSVGSAPSLLRDPFVAQSRLAELLGSHYDEEQRVYPLGYRDVGSNNSVIRFRSARACQWVRVHVQHDGGGGGGVNYNASTFASSTQYDQRSERQRDVTVSRDGTNNYYVWLIPEFEESDGTFTKFDGADGDDHMAFMDLGV